MQKFPLRPHHGLCIGFFEGRGYSDKFTENMYAVISNLKENSKIELTVKTDIICSACPNKIENNCVTAEKVEEFDRQVLNYCGLHDGDIITWKNFRDLIICNILKNQNIFEKICHNCKWYEICLKHMSKI